MTTAADKKKSPTKSKPTASSQASGGKKSSAGKNPPKKKVYEDVFSGRLLVALGLLLAIVLIPVSFLGQMITKRSPETTSKEQWKVGQKATVLMTVTTADFDGLACLDPNAAGEEHCEFAEPRKPFARPAGAPEDDNKKHVLQPYRSTDGNLLLIPGLWAQPAFAMRPHNEPSQGVSQKKLARFGFSCELEFLEERTATQVRWSRGDRWANQGKAMVARASSCKIFEGKQVVN